MKKLYHIQIMILFLLCSGSVFDAQGMKRGRDHLGAAAPTGDSKRAKKYDNVSEAGPAGKADENGKEDGKKEASGDKDKEKEKKCPSREHCTCEDVEVVEVANPANQWLLRKAVGWAASKAWGLVTTVGSALLSSGEAIDPRLKLCLQQTNPKIRAEHKQKHGLHCGYYAFAHAWRCLTKSPTHGNATRIWLHEQLGNAKNLGSWEVIVDNGRRLNPDWEKQKYPRSINNLTSEDLELMARHELKKVIMSPIFIEKTGVRLDEKNAMALAQAARNNFQDIDAVVKNQFDRAFGARCEDVYNFLNSHPLCNIVIIDSLTQARDICFGQGLTPLIAGCVDRRKNKNIAQAVVINTGADSGDHSAITHWIAWSIDEKGVESIFDSMHNSPIISKRQIECCDLLGKVYAETSEKLNARATVIAGLQTVMVIYLQADEKSPEYRDNIISFLGAVLKKAMHEDAPAKAKALDEIKAAREAQEADVEQKKLSFIVKAHIVTGSPSEMGDLINLVDTGTDSLIEIVKAIRIRYRSACSELEKSGRTYDAAKLKEIALRKYLEMVDIERIKRDHAKVQSVIEDYLKVTEFLAAKYPQHNYKEMINNFHRHISSIIRI